MMPELLIDISPGAVVFSATTVTVLAEHPLVGSVAVSVYVPPFVTLVSNADDVKPLGPVQLYVKPDVDTVPVMLTVGWLQVTVPALEAAIPVGGVIFCVTTTWLEAVQLLAGLVTVKVYVPAVLIDALGVVAITPLPLLQL
jgi:hypothetical protein